MRVVNRFGRRHAVVLFFRRILIAASFAVPSVCAASETPAICQTSMPCIDHAGMCDASAAERVGSGMFVVASDEDNLLRVYQSETPGRPIYTFNLNFFLRPDGKHSETDMEAAARIGDRIYWITSHGTNKNGRQRSARHRFFATRVTANNGRVTIEPVGTPYKDLVEDLAMAPQLRRFKLGQSARRPHQVPGALNIEGLCATPRGTLLIGFRNPIPAHHALLVPLENPARVIAGERARFGEPLLLSLGGLGIRSIAYWKTRKMYLIVAGPSGDSGVCKLYQWSGDASGKPILIRDVDFSGLQPEAMVIFPEHEGSILIFSDDGKRRMAGGECKKLPPDERHFRTFWVRP